MKLLVNNDTGNGTHYQGVIETRLARLKKILGTPYCEEFCGYPMEKTTTEWTLTFPCGTIATIYDWKLRRQPKGLYEWHIGGKDKVAVHLVHDLIKGKVRYEINNAK